MRRTTPLAVAAIALAAALSTGPAAAADTHARAASARSNPSAAYNCSAGYFCIYSDWNGSGTRCQWSQSKLANTADNCSFIQKNQPVHSVWNGTSHRVQYYTETNYHSRVGSTTSGNGGNLMGTYQIRSFKPQ